MKNPAFRFFVEQKWFILFLLAIQIGFIITVTITSSLYISYLDTLFKVISVIVCIHILNKNNKPAFKITWIFLTLAFPFAGGVLYIVFYIQSNPKRYRRSVRESTRLCRPFFLLPPQSLDALKGTCAFIGARYLQEHAGLPVYAHTESVYFSSGEAFYTRLLAELEKAERYIFLEFFIISKGVMLDGIMNILIKKARSGLDIRIIYDDLGSLGKLPARFKATLKKHGIKFLVFNPIRPALSSLQNYRDHRKVVSIDGRTAFTGGVNIGDEYINIYKRFGHWKDAALMIKGHAAWGLTLLFMRMWNSGLYLPESSQNEDYGAFYPWRERPCTIEGDGLVQPFSGNPISKEYECEQVYIRMIYNAKDYIYISTPYLIPDEAVLSALVSQALSGTDVRILTPRIPDKPLVHRVSRSYYRRLIASGVRIYEYTKGFNHSKIVVSDDICAAVGSANLDFRSLCLHFECGVWLYKTKSVLEIKEDFIHAFRDSSEITAAHCSRHPLRRITDNILRIAAPLF